MNWGATFTVNVTAPDPSDPNDTDDENWVEVARYDGLSGAWQDISLSLPQLDGAASAQVRFRFTSDFSVTVCSASRTATSSSKPSSECNVLLYS